MSRFLTTELLQAEAESRKKKTNAWKEEERKREQKRQDDLEARRREESLYLPHQNALEPTLVALWNEFAAARGFTVPSTVRTETGFELVGVEGGRDREILTVSITQWVGLQVVHSPWFSQNNPSARDFAASLAKETGYEVELLDDSGRVIQAIEL